MRIAPDFFITWKSKIRNQRVLLQRNGSAPSRTLDALAEELSRAEQAKSIDSLRGHEGQAAALFFAQFASMVKDEALAAFFDANGATAPTAAGPD